MQVITTLNAQSPIGPYAQAIVANGFLFCSGHAGVDPHINQIVEGIEPQTRQVLHNLHAVLVAAGATLYHVVQVTVYLKQMDDFTSMNAIYARMFGDHKPARTTIAVSALAKPGALVVMDRIAVVPAVS
ncbi:MAG: deaminase [Ktedonobacterales bacterium]|nr:deaminase [Ktedonobacterales bacterium]